MPTVKQYRIKFKSELGTKTIMREIGGNPPVPIKVTVWDDPHALFQITEKDVGAVVSVASESWTYEAEVLRVRPASVKLGVLSRDSDRGVGSVRDLYREEVIKHPDYLTEDEISEYFEVYDGRSR